jgi:hypothetical protein
MGKCPLLGAVSVLAGVFGSGCSGDARDQSAVSAQHTSLTGYGLFYHANDQENLTELGTCSSNSVKSMRVMEPDGAGPYPVFLYMGGTWEAYDDAPIRRILEEAVRQGFVAASIQYRNGTAP